MYTYIVFITVSGRSPVALIGDTINQLLVMLICVKLRKIKCELLKTSLVLVLNLPTSLIPGCYSNEGALCILVYREAGKTKLRILTMFIREMCIDCPKARRN